MYYVSKDSRFTRRPGLDTGEGRGNDWRIAEDVFILRKRRKDADAAGSVRFG